MNWCGFGIDGVWFDDCKGEGYFYKTTVKGQPTRFIGFNIRFGFFRFVFGKENRKIESRKMYNLTIGKNKFHVTSKEAVQKINKVIKQMLYRRTNK